MKADQRYIVPPLEAPSFSSLGFSWALRTRQTIGSIQSSQPQERIMAKGAMKAGKEARKPKKDAKKPAPEPALKAPPVKATRLKDK
ncbi:hypothetical protein [Mesorhizobium sp. A623]